MIPRNSNPGAGGPPAEAFPTTHWSWVDAAGKADSPQARDALARLCETYWYPLYAYVRRSGRDAVDAQDLTQEFFCRLIAENFVAGAVQERGRFRSFLLVALKRFLIDEWQRGRAQKRGGGLEVVSLDAEEAEHRYGLEPVDPMTAERIYERRWALTVLDTVMENLRREQVGEMEAALFQELKPFLYGDAGAVSQGEIANRFGLTGSAVKARVHRLRQRYRVLLRDEVARTLARSLDVEDELRHLLEVLRS